MRDVREGGRPGAYRGAGAGAASSYGTRAASGKAGAPSSSEDSLLELLELLLLLIVASERGLDWVRPVPVGRDAARAATRACVGQGSVHLEDWLPFGGVVVVHAQRRRATPAPD